MKLNKWFYLISLSVIWGSSFILIKKGLIGLEASQLGSLRIIFSSFIIFLFGWRKIFEIRIIEWKWITISAFLGSFFPAFLFAFAEKEIDSSVASIINSTVPLNTLILGIIIFKINTTKRQIIGVLIGFFGTYLLISSGIKLNPDQNYNYAGLVILCSFLYALNVNIIKKYLQHLSALTITVGHFTAIIIPAILVFVFSEFRIENLNNAETKISIFYVFILALFGTALAKIIFNKLIKISSPVFASSVTYSMLIVSIFWGIIDGEKFSIYQLIATGFIVLGVILTNRSINTKN
ncbi:MAG: permease [Flavobacteriales bacterium]|jgi:drug/metabolite transporter (DMT)-like permease|nr:permease [Flavobacteriales bacterium]|tara:strand:- start:2303 stop:3181 length:879 start_codon:yes stop_codon:yes gene_type:complete